MLAADLINARLPDELLLHIFAFLPCLTARVLDGGVTLGSLGAAERVCRRWRRLALGLAGQHPVGIWCRHFALQGSLLGLQQNSAAVHCLGTRAPAVVAVHWPTPAVALLLGATQLLSVRKLTIEVPKKGVPALLRSLPHTFPALEELHTHGSIVMLPRGEVDAGAYPAALRLLPHLTAVDLLVPAITPDLAAALLALPQLHSVRLMLHGPLPGPATWQQLGQLGPRLRHLSLALHNPGERVPPELFELPSTVELGLHIYDDEPGEVFEGLQRLPSLRRLTLCSQARHFQPVPSACWACCHLTALCLEGFFGIVPAGASAMLSTLRRLELSNVYFPQGDFPAEFCLLHQLTGLKLDEPNLDPCLPSGLNQLSNLQELVIHSPVRPGALATEVKCLCLTVLRTLCSLTHLELSRCDIGGPPVLGVFPESLAQLSILHCGRQLTCALLSPQLFSNTHLQHLRLALRLESVEDEWQSLEAALRAHTSLQVLAVEFLDKYGWDLPLRERQLLRQKVTGLAARVMHLPST